MRVSKLLSCVLSISLLLALAGSAKLGFAQGPGPEGNAEVQAAPVGTAFTYQGRLTDGGSPANGDYDFQFTLYDAESGGSQVGSTVTVDDVTVTDGLFTVQLDFETGVFTGEARWLQIAVRPGDSTGAYTTLSPRQALTPAPYALALPGLWTQQNTTSPNLIGGYSGNSVTDGVVGATIGGGGKSLWTNRVTDDYGTVGGGQANLAGDNDANTTDASHATVGGGRYNCASADYATVSGGWGNAVTADYATIGGGYDNDATADYATIGGGDSNEASGSYAAVSGGYNNNASGYAATIGGGSGNDATATFATIGGGSGNVVTATHATVGGGWYNNASGECATVSGGFHNDASGPYATVGGGYDNSAAGDATVGGGYKNIASGLYATVGGGYSNSASNLYATIGGGSTNTASGSYAAVPGGYGNTASGAYSFAAGRRAQALHDGAIILADSNNFDFASTVPNSFKVRSTGGIRFVLGIDDSGNMTWSCLVTNGTSWSCTSDRNQKENLRPVDGFDILQHLSDVPIFTWNGRGQDPSIRHMGPMAQDFYAAFGLGEDDTHIATIDLDGVALAAIQGLYALSQEQAARIEALEAENAQLRAEHSAQQMQIDQLEARLAALEAQVNGSAPSGALQSGLLPGVGMLLLGAGAVWTARRRGGE